MDAIVDAAVGYSLSHEENRITLQDLEQAFINGARWMVEDKTDKNNENSKNS